MSAAAAVERTNLVELLNELTGSAPHNQRWNCIVPRHEDNDPSTTVFEDSHGTQRWKCWSCGHGGTAIDALVEARSMTVAEAISTLEERTNTVDENRTPRFDKAPTRPSTVALSDAAHRYLTDCAAALWEPGGADARNWLRLRGLDDQVLRDNLVGFDPGPQSIPRASGLPGNMGTRGERRRQGLPGGSGVTFVSFDRHGEPSHVQCRLLHAHSYKYANPRRQHGSIPAVSFPKTAIEGGPVLVTEGVADGLVAVTAGFRAAVVTAATTVRASTATEITRHASGHKVVLAFDNDDAGRCATAALKSQLTGDVAVLKLPENHDLTDTYKGRHQCQPASNSQIISTR